MLCRTAFSAQPPREHNGVKFHRSVTITGPVCIGIHLLEKFVHRRNPSGLPSLRPVGLLLGNGIPTSPKENSSRSFVCYTRKVHLLVVNPGGNLPASLLRPPVVPSQSPELAWPPTFHERNRSTPVDWTTSLEIFPFEFI